MCFSGLCFTSKKGNKIMYFKVEMLHMFYEVIMLRQEITLGDKNTLGFGILTVYLCTLILVYHQHEQDETLACLNNPGNCFKPTEHQVHCSLDKNYFTCFCRLIHFCPAVNIG